ncbi:MAG: DUF2062 domain-containing protein [Chthoniobacteraceae bacterium]
MQRQNFWLKRLTRLMPRRRHLHGGWLHRVLGERLFDPELWKFTRHSVAGGLAVGLFIAFTPTMGVQIVLSALAAYFLRVNIPIAAACAFVTNPVTAPIIYPLQLKLGVWLVGVPTPDELANYSITMRGFARYGRPLGAGGLFVGAVAGLIGWFTAHAFASLRHKARAARKLMRLRKLEAQRLAASQQEAESNAGTAPADRVAEVKPEESKPVPRVSPVS